MKKNILFFLFFLSVFSLKAQMYVSPNSYVFVNDAFVYVEQDVNMNGNGAFYLRKQAQLLQGRTTPSANQGTGILSVFQEGTSNNYGYNYWCSPVGDPDIFVGNSPFILSQLNRATSVTNSTPATILPYASQNGSTSSTSLSIASRWVWTYEAANLYNPGGANGWQYVGNIGTVGTGLGFTMKGVSGTDATIAHPVSGSLGDGVSNNPLNNQRYDFRGRPNDGTITVSVGSIAGPNYPNQTLTGNPYPSAINLNLFLLENSGYTVNYTTGTYSLSGTPNINGNAYFWEHRKTAGSHVLATYEGGYGAYAPNGATAFVPGTYTSATWNTYNGDGTPNTTGATSGVAYTRMFTPVGQGFMIRGVSGGSGIATMLNRYRTFVKEAGGTNSQFERNAQNLDTSNWAEIPNVANVDYTQFSKLPVPQFKIHTVMNNQYTRETAIAFNNNATDGYDYALDAVSSETNLPKDTYFPLNNDEQFVITTLPFDINKRIPVAFKTDVESSFKVSVSELINFNLAENIYLHDKLTEAYHDIKNNYFEVSLPAGVYTNRFEVTFKNENELLSNSTQIANSFQVYQNNEQGMLTLFNSLNKDVKAVTLYDITGKIVINKLNLGTASQYEIPTSNLSDGVYVVKLSTSDNYSVDKKVAISKK